MGALPSRETHQRGLYSHRHGRNRRSEIILIPLTSDFFPSPDCPLFQHLYNARYRRTAKYYYRALRSAQTSHDSDYFCTSSKLSEPEEFEKFNAERLARQKHQQQQQPQPHRATSQSTAATSGAAAAGTKESEKIVRPSVVDDYDYQSFTDTLEGLYHVLITENDLCLYDTDEQLREAYAKQVAHQRREWEMMSKRYVHNAANPASNPAAGAVPDVPCTFENVPFDAFVSGYHAAKQYMRGKRLHTQVNQDVQDGDPASSASGSEGGSGAKKGKHARHITSPAAYYIHPVPCVIASRWDSNKPAPVDDPLYVQFEGFYVKIMGMFGTFPSTVVMRSEHDEARSKSHPRPYPRKEGNPGGDNVDAVRSDEDEEGDEGEGSTKGCAPVGNNRNSSSQKARGAKGPMRRTDVEAHSEMETEQHMLKGTMFIDKDVGDQILGNMVMLAAHMYVRQCVRAQIKPRYMPAMPFFMRFPLSNIPMLQFLREFRVRLRTLLEAGTAKSGQKPMHVGMSGFNPMDIAETHHQQKAKLEEEGFLFEEDIPNVLADTGALFMGPAEAQAVSFTSHRTSINTNEGGQYPIFMLSGFNVQNTPLRHPALSETGYVPAFTQHTQPQPSSPLQRGAPPPPPPPPFPGTQGPAPHGNNSSMKANNANVPGAGLEVNKPTSPTTSLVQTSTIASETHKSMLLTRRKNRFRVWIEDGHVCLWASAAYTRRACLILAQQLNTTVDSHSVPEQRSWMLRGLLHAGAVVPTPKTVNDVVVVAEDMPQVGLWQGDVLRCCTAEEHRAMQARVPLPLPCRSGNAGDQPGSPTNSQHSSSPTSTNPTSAAGGGFGNASSGGLGAIGSSLPSAQAHTNPMAGMGLDSPLTGSSAAAAAGGANGHVNFTGNHPSNPLLQEKQQAPLGAFWVRAAGGLDDSYTNISETNMPPNPKMAKQLQQAAQQRAKKLAAAAAALNRLHAGMAHGNKGGSNSLASLIPGSHSSSDSVAAATAAAASLALSMASDFLEIDRREGTLNLEEVVLSWVRVVSMLSRESSSETEGDWVRDPSGSPVRIDRFVFRRLEFEGVRFFIGVTPRFVGQQRRIEKVLGEVYAMDKRAASFYSGQQEASGSGPNSPASGLHSVSGFSGSGLYGNNTSSASGAIGATLPSKTSDEAEARRKAAAAVLGGTKGLAGLAPEEDEVEEDHEDVLERMGFGSRKLREAFEESHPNAEGKDAKGQPAKSAEAGNAAEEDPDMLERFDFQEYLLTED